MRSIRILWVRNCRGITGITGAERYLLTLFQGFRHEACECKLVCIVDPRHGETPWLREVKSRGIDHVCIPVSRTSDFRDVLTLPKLVREYNADLIHTIDHRADIAGVLGARRSARAVVVSFFGWTNFEATSLRGRLYPWLDRQAQRRADAIIVDSAYMRSQLNTGSKWPPVVVIPNGVEVSRFDSSKIDTTVRSRFFNGDEIVVLGMLGRIHPVKGQLEFLRAGRLLCETHPQCRLLIVGSAPPGYAGYMERIKSYIEDYGLSSKAIVTDVHTSEVPSVLNAMDIVLAPSYEESFSFTIIEAMFMNRPVVASSAGGNPEILTNGELGLLVPPGDVDALAHAARLLIEAPERRAKMGSRARRWVLDNCSERIMAERTMSVYREVLKWRSVQMGRRFSSEELQDRIAVRIGGNR